MMDPIYILPALALGSIFLFPATKRIRRNGQRVVSSTAEPAILWSRWLVGSLFFGSIVGVALYILGVQHLAAGVLATLVVLVPATVYYGLRWVKARFRKSRRERNEQELNEKMRAENAKARTTTPSPQSNASQNPYRRSRNSAEQGVQAELKPGLAPEMAREFSVAFALDKSSSSDSAVSGAAILTRKNKESADSEAALVVANTVKSAGAESSAAQEGEQLVGEQLAQIDENVRSWTLDDTPVERDVAARDASLEAAGQALATVAASSDKPAASVEPELELDARHLATLDKNEMRSMVINLRSEKHKLQKLVLAQKASLDAERAANERTHEYARAIEEQLQESSLKQQRVTKIARRERAQRLKLEARLDTVTRALRNVQSTLKNHDLERENVEA